MRRVAFASLPLAVLFLANVFPSNAQTAPAVPVVWVAEGAPLAVECALGAERAPAWALDGGAPPPDLAKGERPAVGAGTAGVVARLTAARASPRHEGLYSCGGAPVARVRLLPPGTGTEAAAMPVAAEEGVEVVYYKLRFDNVSMNCAELNTDPAVPVVWERVNDTGFFLSAAQRERWAQKEGVMALTNGRRATEEDAGLYVCRAGDRERRFRLAARSVPRLPENTNGVEELPAVIVCKLTGKPYTAVNWTFNPDGEDANGSVPVHQHFGERAKLMESEQGVEGARLVIEPLQRGDQGWLLCHAAGGSATSTLRVKDKYAALWPFLGICAEVVVLCVVILVYERRRAKPELEDSDTDNHDQKKS